MGIQNISNQRPWRSSCTTNISNQSPLRPSHDYLLFCSTLLHSLLHDMYNNVVYLQNHNNTISSQGSSKSHVPVRHTKHIYSGTCLQRPLHWPQKWSVYTAGLWWKVQFHWNVRLSARNIRSFKAARWSLMAVVSQDRFHCTCKNTRDPVSLQHCMHIHIHALTPYYIHHYRRTHFLRIPGKEHEVSCMFFQFQFNVIYALAIYH